MKHNPIVYFIKDHESGLIKIGTTASIKQRFVTLQVEYGRKLEILGFIYGDRDTEKGLHKHFVGVKASYKEEWFQDCADIRGYIAANCLSVDTINTHEDSLIQVADCMFDVNEHQNVADRLKALLFAHVNTPGDRKATKPTLDRLQKFEAGGWHPAAFQNALSQVDTLAIRGDKSFVFLGTGKPNDAIVTLLEIYDQLLSPDPAVNEPTVVDNLNGLYKMRAAARYIDVAESTMKRYYHTLHLIPAVKSEDGDLHFRREDLDWLKVNKPKAGGYRGRREKVETAE